MSTKFYQACFAHVDTGNLSTGWQVVNTSANIMQSMVSFFENSEKSNDVSVNKKNADGSPLKVTKIICDGKNIGLTQVKYGLSDKVGRACFFSHGYIANDSYEVLKTPENILNISDDNFHFSVEETQSIPEELKYTEARSEKDIMEKYGLNRDLCVNFVKCALFPLFSSAQTTVFVKTDGSREMAMDLLYIIYHSLPYSLRPRVTASTYAKPTGGNSMYVFTDDIPGIGKYVDPITGENNILNETYEKRLDRFAFAAYYVEHIPQTLENHNKYYAAFEDVLRDMGDIHISKMESLRLAFMTLASSEISDNEIGGLLYDWLSLPVPINDKIITKIDKIVHIAIAKGIELSENVIKLLQDRIKESNSDVLYNAYVNYEAGSLIKSETASLKKLDLHRRDKGFYMDLCAVLRQTPEGEALLNSYYCDSAQQLVDLRSCSYNDMISLIAECNYIADIQNIRNIFCDKCRQILLAEQKRGKNFKAIYSAYKKAINEIDPNVKISWKEFTDEYDASFRSEFNVNCVPEYEEFYSIYTQYPWSSDFLKVWKDVGNKKFNVATEYVRRDCCLGNYKVCPEDIQKFSKYILEYALANDAAEICDDMQFWYTFAGILNYGLIDLMAQKRASVLCDPETLATAIDSDNFWWELDNLEFIYDSCKQYCEENDDQDSITKYTIHILKDQIAKVKKSMAAEEKKKKKESSEHSNPLLNLIKRLICKSKHTEQDEDTLEKPKKEKHKNTDNKKNK